MNRKTMVIAIGFLLAFCIGIHFYAEWNMAQFDASLPKPPDPEQEAHAAPQELDPHAGHNHGPGEHPLVPPVEPSDMALNDFLASPPLSSAEVQNLWAKSGTTPEEYYDSETLEVFKKFGVEPPPPGHTWAQLPDGTTELREKNVPYVTVRTPETTGHPPVFDFGWLPDNAAPYHLALRTIAYDKVIVLPEGNRVELTSAERVRAVQMLTDFETAWAPHTDFSFGATGVYDNTISEAESRAATDAAAEKVERELKLKLGISPDDNISPARFVVDYDLVREILTEIKRLSTARNHKRGKGKT